MPGEDESELGRELDRLYALPFDEFTAARTTLARRLRQEGQRASAATVGEQRKPTLPAWVVNQLVRKRELDIQRLIKAGEQLGAAQAEAVRGHGAEAFLEARRQQQRALQRLASAARGILDDTGRPVEPNLDRVLATLRAASLTPEGRSLLKQGRLAQELEPPGFEALSGFGPVDPARPATPRKRSAPDDRQDGAKEEPSAARGEQERRKREQTAQTRQRIRDLRADLRRYDSDLRAVKRRANQLRKQLEATDAEADALERRRREAEAELDAAERALTSD